MTENKKSKLIKQIDNILSDKRLSSEQRETMVQFDRFNELEAGCRISTRESYVRTVRKLGLSVTKPFEQMTREDVQDYVRLAKQHHAESVVDLQMRHLKRFFRYLRWLKENKHRPENRKVDIRDVKAPYQVSWIRNRFRPREIPFEDLPTEEEVLKIVSCVDNQRDRALYLTLWETGASPKEVLSLRMKSVVFNQYGAVIHFRRYSDSKTKTPVELKTEFRYRSVPIATSVADIQLWISMHPQKDELDAPLWPSQHGGALGYNEVRRKFIKAVKKAGIKKHLTLYSLRHMRLTQVADVLPSQQLKQFAGHSQFSQVTPRYIHVNSKQIQERIYRERGVKLEEPEQKEPILTVKTCPRCRHKNSPTYRFCAMCSMPLDIKTVFEIQKKAEFVEQGLREYDSSDGLALADKGEDEDDDFMWAVFQYMLKRPERYQAIMKEAVQRVVVEVMRKRTPRPT